MRFEHQHDSLPKFVFTLLHLIFRLIRISFGCVYKPLLQLIVGYAEEECHPYKLVHQLRNVGMSHLNGKMKQAYQTESDGILAYEISIGTALSPVVTHQEKRETIEKHDNEGKQAEQYIGFGYMRPQVLIRVDGGIYNTCTHTDNGNCQQGCKQKDIYHYRIDKGLHHFQRIQEEYHLDEYGNKSMFRIKESPVDRKTTGPCTEYKGKGKESRYPAEDGLDGTRIVMGLLAASPQKDAADDESQCHQGKEKGGYVKHLLSAVFFILHKAPTP
jgi:hypothetical protein